MFHFQFIGILPPAFHCRNCEKSVVRLIRVFYNFRDRRSTREE